MSYTQTPNYSLYKPTINADNDQWGTHLNANADTLDSTLKTVSNAAQPALNNVGRNRIHNPLFNIAQRGAGPFTTAGGTFTLDRWPQDFLGGTMNTLQAALVDSDRAAIGDEAAVHAWQTVMTGGGGATAYTLLYHNIESVRRLSGKTVTVSFWAIASAALKVGVSIDQVFGTGGSPSANVSGVGQAVTVGTTWARYSVTTTVPSTSGKTLGTNGNDFTELNLWLSAGTNNGAFSGNIGVQSGTFRFWGVQLEIGSVATPLDKPDPQQDLAKCQRFYVGNAAAMTFSFNSWAANAFQALPVYLPVPMRASPTVVIGGGSGNTNVGSVVPIDINQQWFFAQAIAQAAGGTGITTAGFTASADL